LETGWTIPKASLAGYEKTAEAHVVADPAKSRFFAPFAEFPTGVPAADRPRLRAEGEKAIREGIVPAYRALGEFLTKEYMPRADHGRVGRPAGRSRVLRPPRASLHDGREDARRDPRPRPLGGQADPRRDGGGHPQDRLCRELRGFPEVPAHGSALLREVAGGALEAGGLDREADRREAAGFL